MIKIEKNYPLAMGYSIGIEDMKAPVPLIKSLSAEFLGTMFLVIIGFGTAASKDADRTSV